MSQQRKHDNIGKPMASKGKRGNVNTKLRLSKQKSIGGDNTAEYEEQYMETKDKKMSKSVYMKSFPTYNMPKPRLFASTVRMQWFSIPAMTALASLAGPVRTVSLAREMTTLWCTP